MKPSFHRNVLLLLPSSDVDSTIRCRLIIKSLDDEHLWHEALPHVWGNPEPSKEIQVNSSICRVGPNLHSALRHLRSENQLRRLWVDAVCINQQDDAEKSHQVAQMGQAYSGAEQTIAWLGDYEGGRLAMELAKRIGENRSDEQLLELCHDKSLVESWVRFLVHEGYGYFS